MRNVDPTSLRSGSACAVIARSSCVAPDFLVGEDHGNALIAARWRRRSVALAEPVCLADHVLSYCMAGTATCSIIVGGTRIDHVQQAGTLTFLPADHPVQWTLDSVSDVVHVHLYICKEAVDAYARQAGGDRTRRPQLQSFVDIRDAWLENYVHLLVSDYELYSSCGRLGDSLFLDQTESLLISRMLLAQAAGARVTPAVGTPARVSPLRPTIVGRVNEFLLKNLDQELRLQQMAEVAGLSVDHFVRAFRQATGVTPYRYLLELRLNRARDLLRDDSRPIARIARDCGFSGAARFSVAFHRRYGLAPSEYRNRH